MLNSIPDNIAGAVYSGDIDFLIFADWLEDHDWPQAAHGFRLFAERGVTIETLQRDQPERLLDRWHSTHRPWRDHRQPEHVLLLCKSMGWCSVPFPQIFASDCLLKPWKRLYRQPKKCMICSRKRRTSELRICRACHVENLSLDNLILPPGPVRVASVGSPVDLSECLLEQVE